MLFERARRQPPSPPPLTIQEVFRAFEQIAGVAGKGTQTRKVALLRACWLAPRRSRPSTCPKLSTRRCAMG